MTTFQKLIGISALIISLTLAYYFLVYLPQYKNEQLNARKNCLLKADKIYSKDWDKTETAGSLTTYTVKRIDDSRTENRNNCFKLYPSN